ncbi:MAG: 50S ribosomal protein L6, partial [Patescibacteria group bacterium]
MSRIGKLPILVPDGVTVNVDGQTVNVTGPKGTLTMTVHRRVSLHLTERQLTVSVVDAEAQSDRALWGLTRMLVANMITGVTAGYQKQLEINGVGFKAQVSGQNLILNLGFSHPVNFPI